MPCPDVDEIDVEECLNLIDDNRLQSIIRLIAKYHGVKNLNSQEFGKFHELHEALVAIKEAL